MMTLGSQCLHLEFDPTLHVSGFSHKESPTVHSLVASASVWAPRAWKALGAGPGLLRLLGTCKMPPRLPSFLGGEGKVSGSRQVQSVTLGLELAKECFPAVLSALFCS